MIATRIAAPIVDRAIRSRVSISRRPRDRPRRDNPQGQPDRKIDGTTRGTAKCRLLNHTLHGWAALDGTPTGGRTMGKRSVLVAAVILAGCGGGGGGGSGPTCRDATEACAVTADCCDTLICTNNVCVGGQTCRAATQACAVTADCCSSLICTNNVCSNPPTCRAANTACAVTADCCSPLVCLGNRCQVAPPSDVCGDAICSGVETTASCCRDCGCPAGTTCNGTTCVNVGLSNMTWSMTHACPTGEQIELRFFDVTNLGV